MAGGYNQNYGGAGIYVDISELQGTINTMKAVMSSTAFNEMMRRTFNEAGRKVKTIVRKEVPKKYEVTASWAGSKVGWPKPQGGGQVGVVIPIKGSRGSIGGRFKVSGARGRPVKGKRAKIMAKIAKGQTSTLPNTMTHQGGNLPFLINAVAFTRKYADKKKPIVHVVGLGVPQMPINKSEPEVQDEIRTYVETRLQHNFGQLFGK